MKRYFFAFFIIALAAGFTVLSGCAREDTKEEAKVDAKVEKTIEADIVIIGGGGAGTTAALTAIQEGVKKVILLEKEDKLGGTSAMAGGTMAGAETHLQKAAGIETSTDEIFTQVMEFNHYDRVNPRVVRAYIDKTADTFKWLEENGIFYQITRGVTHSPMDSTGATENFRRTIDKLSAKFAAAGGQILLNTKAEKILRGPDGKINSVIASNKKGETILINTKTVILATGGFTGNEELLYKYFPDYYDSEVYYTEAVKTNVGDGIKLAADAGASLSDYATLVRETGYSFFEGENNFANRLAGQANAWVNKRGERFQNETKTSNHATNALLQQPGKVGFALFDDKRVQKINNRLRSQGQDSDLKEFYKAEDKKGEWVKISESWDGIASWIGADPAVLKATVEEYNSFCEQGRDAIFARDPQSMAALLVPPYYAVKVGPLMIDTYGPVRINEHMEVLDKDDNPIPGFYAGGAICSGYKGPDIDPYFWGSELGFAVTSGQIAGESAARYISGK